LGLPIYTLYFTHNDDSDNMYFFINAISTLVMVAVFKIVKIVRTKV